MTMDTEHYWYMRGFIACIFFCVFLVIFFVWLEGEAAYYRWQHSLSRERSLRAAVAPTTPPDNPHTDDPPIADNSKQSQTEPVTAA